MPTNTQHPSTEHKIVPQLHPLLLVGILTLIGLGLRLYTIGSKPLWLDEAFSIWLAQQPVREMWAWLVQIDQHPPLYYTLLHYWIAWVGDGQGWVRFFSALCSGLAIPLLYGAGRNLGTPRTALIAALLLTFSPFHVRYAQEARMYALLILGAATAIYLLTLILWAQRLRAARWPWLGLALAQTAIMLTHNSAAIFFPLALNSIIGGVRLWHWWAGTLSALPALGKSGFLRRWLAMQLLAVLGWLPWSGPFFIQSSMVDQEFWIAPPTVASVYETLHTFTFAFLPGWSPMIMSLNVGCWLLAGLGAWSLRRTPERACLLVALWLLPLCGELLISLRRPIFSDRTLIWTTLPYYLLLAIGIDMVGYIAGRYRRSLSTGLLILILGLNSSGLYQYYTHFAKEEWDKAATYVAQRIAPGDLILLHASWIQLPFQTYFRHTGNTADLRGVPVDLFDRGILEPKMTEDDLPRLQRLIAGRSAVWLIYSHDWYTDPQAIIPGALQQTMTLVEERTFLGLRVLHFQRPP